MKFERLYLDMDGVLMDFEGAISAHGIVPFPDGKHWIHKPREQWPPEMVEADRRYVGVMELETFWPSLGPLPDAHVLWNFCRPMHPFVLTATPNTTDHRDRIARQKRESIWSHFDSTFDAEDILVCLRKEKQAFARCLATGRPNLLVDDTPSNCAEWEAAGGIAICHATASNTITHLRNLCHG